MSAPKDATVRIGVDAGQVDGSAAVMLVDGKVVDVKDISFSFDEVHVWAEGAMALDETKRTGTVEFDVDLSPTFYAGGWDDPWSSDRLQDFKTAEDEPLEPVLAAPDGSDCDHPEDRREPLPYQGRAADPREWECGACGAWRVHEPTERRTITERRTMIDQIGKVYGVPSSIIATPAARVTSGADVDRLVQDELRKKKTQMEDEMLAETFGRLPTPPFDARRSLSVETVARPEQVYLMDGTVDALSFPRIQDVVVTGPVNPSMTDDDVVRVIQEMEVLANEAAARTRDHRRWVMDNQSAYRVSKIASSYSPFVTHSVEDPRAKRIIGYPLEVTDRAPRYKIQLVCE